MRPANRPGALHARTNLHNAIPPGGADPHPGPPGSLPPGGPPVLSRRFPQAPLWRRRPAPAGLPHSPGRTPLSPSLSPGRAPPGPGWSPPAGRTASPPPVRDRAVWTHPPPEEPPFFQQGTAPILEDQHTAQRRARMASRLCPGALRYRQAPSAVRGQHPRAAPQAGGGKKS